MRPSCSCLVLIRLVGRLSCASWAAPGRVGGKWQARDQLRVQHGEVDRLWNALKTFDPVSLLPGPVPLGNLACPHTEQEMPTKPRAARDTLADLTFLEQPGTTVYLHPGRIGKAYIGHLGTIKKFVLTSSGKNTWNGKVSVVFAEGATSHEGGDTASVEYDLDNPFGQALLLRAYLTDNHRLATDVRSAGPMDFVCIRGRGRILHPQDSQSRTIVQGGLPRRVADEIEEERAERDQIWRPDDPVLHYWAAYAGAPPVLAVALMGASELNASDAMNWRNTDVTCCIFGEKISDRGDWTLVSPWHVWLEPLARRA